MSTQGQTQDHKYSNHLTKETSPYLLQHAHNPVDWYPWGQEALDKAKSENKLILVSIGYSACHWCHVMERESFENEEIAHIMNEHFVCIKVDREERPDVDQVYMNAVHLMKGQGGWPLNCFALPDGKPVYGATYFPPSQWKQTLKSLYLSYNEDPKKFEDYAENLLNGIAQSEIIATKTSNSELKEIELHNVFENLSRSFDMKEGGFGNAPKFPLPIGLEFCLNYGAKYDNKKALDFAYLTLDKMAMGGIYDQIGGGFARYSVDGIWKVPHFEKMLYDNSQLVSLYSHAYKLNPSPLYKRSILQTLEFIKREMTQEEGGFFSALDADSEGVEGKFYIWKKEEIEIILGEKSEFFCEYYGVKNGGNWEHGSNILMQQNNEENILNKYSITIEELQTELEVLGKTLLEVREKRIRPGLDDKIITSWNALMLKAYLDAFVTLGYSEHLQTAERNADFLWNKLSNKEGKLLRTYKNGTAKIDAFLDDYAITIDAFISLYEITFNQNYLNKAQLLMEYSLENFLHPESKMFYYTAKDKSLLVARKMEITDNVIPASNSIMANNLISLGTILSDNSMTEHARIMLQNVKSDLPKGQAYYANWDILMMRHLSPIKEVVIMGDDCISYSQTLQKSHSFNTVFVGSKNSEYLPLMEKRFQQDKTLIYVCENKTCQLPLENTKDAINLLVNTKNQ